ncbi:MAG: BrnT family toxin [Acetobacteraceae bacterium]
MQTEFDLDKDAANRAKHGVPLAAGLFVLESRIGEVVDSRRDYGEERMNAFGFIEGRLFVCTYTMRGEICRIISVRKASRQEQRQWQPSE